MRRKGAQKADKSPDVRPKTILNPPAITAIYGVA